MRIFYAAHDQGNHTISSKTWYNNLYLPLSEISDEIIRFDYDLFKIALHQDPTISSNRDIILEERQKIEIALLKQITNHHKKKPIDVFFSYFASSYCLPEVIREIGEMGIITINWFCNASYQFYLVEKIAAAYNYCLVPEKFRMEDYKKAGANPVYCQEAANPKIYKPYDIACKYDISFIGGRYADRYKYIKLLHNAGMNPHVWGENWQRRKSSLKVLIEPVYNLLTNSKTLPLNNLHGYLEDDEMIKTFSATKINLGFAKCGNFKAGDPAIKQVRLRDFEIPMSGGFYLTEHTEELADFFEADKEIVFFYDEEECIDKAKYYLKNIIQREKIRRSGYKRATAEHTWQKRLGKVFSELNIK